jgi:hypothetical protein
MGLALTQATKATLATGVQAKNIDALDEQGGSVHGGQAAAPLTPGLRGEAYDVAQSKSG